MYFVFVFVSVICLIDTKHFFLPSSASSYFLVLSRSLSFFLVLSRSLSFSLILSSSPSVVVFSRALLESFQ